MVWRFGGFVAAAAVVLLAVSAAFPQEYEGEEKVREAAQGLLPYFASSPPAGLADRFTPAFRKTMADKQIDLESVFAGFAIHGKATEVRLVRMTRPYGGEVEFLFDKGVRVPAVLTLEAKAPHRIAGLLFRAALKDNETLDDIVREVKNLPGAAGFTLMRLDPDPRIVWEHNGTQPLAVGSAFKLLVLAALVEDVQAGRRAWSDVVPLRKELASLPSGLLHSWPDGAPVTLHTLATLMISRSDNTATDHLIDLLGRARVEAVQKPVGVQAPERNQPFLTTAETFKLKLVLPPEQQREYLAADPAGRRRLLETLVKPAPLAKARTLSTPQLIEEVEWFYSTADLCRVMDWLRRQEKAAAARDILAVHSGVSLDTTFWSYVGYKGGSEPGVLNVTLLLQAKSGAWFAFAMTWNNPEREVDSVQLIGLAQRLLRLAQRTG
jgi:beta-lactamase class A